MQLATRVDDKQGILFKETTQKLGTTPSDALRMFVAAFNAHQGFPYDVRLFPSRSVEAFTSEKEAVDFTTSAMKKALDEAWGALDDSRQLLRQQTETSSHHPERQH